MNKQILLILFLLAAFCAVPVFAQENSEGKQKQVGEEQYKAFCQPDFVGESISLNVVNADIRDILNYITKQSGFEFAVDSSIGRKVASVNIDDVPWNVALGNILEPEELGIQCNGRFFLITTQKKITEEGRCVFTEAKPDNSPLYTEFIKLKKLPVCPNKNKCQQASQALNHLKTHVAQRLTKRGQIEVDEASQTLIITDARDNINVLRNLVPLLDNEEFYNEAGKGK